MLQNFGTALSREQMRMVKGGDDGSQYCADTIAAAGGRWISHDSGWIGASFGSKQDVINDGNDNYCYSSCLASCCAAIGC